jgi:outer membrane protein assembly factor BamB
MQLVQQGDSPMKTPFKFQALTAAALLALAALSPARAADAPTKDWPQWRGPTMTGAALPDAKPPTEWSEQKNIKWKVAIPGTGIGTPIVVGDRIFLQAAVEAANAPASPAASVEGANPLVRLVQTPPPRRGPGGPGGPGGRGPGGPGGGRGGQQAATKPLAFSLLCIERATGKTAWQRVARQEIPAEGHHQTATYANQSPVSDGKLVFTLFGSHGLYCYDLEGNQKWSKDLGKMQAKMGFGEGSSPALHGDTLVVNWDHEGPSFLVAFDKNTGNELWRTPRQEGTTWATPLIVEHDGKGQVVVAATGMIRSYDLKTGKEIWRCDGRMTDNVIPTPVADTGIVYVTSGFRGAALLAIKLGKTGDLTGSDSIAWTANKGTPYVPSPLLYNGRLYLFEGNTGRLSCYDVKTGKALLSQQRIDDIQGVYASPVAANGHIYLLSQTGAGVVMNDGEQPKEVRTNQLDDQFNASPAIAGNELFLRGFRSLYCVAEK